MWVDVQSDWVAFASGGTKCLRDLQHASSFDGALVQSEVPETHLLKTPHSNFYDPINSSELHISQCLPGFSHPGDFNDPPTHYGVSEPYFFSASHFQVGNSINSSGLYSFHCLPGFSRADDFYDPLTHYGLSEADFFKASYSQLGNSINSSGLYDFHCPLVQSQPGGFYDPPAHFRVSEPDLLDNPHIQHSDDSDGTTASCIGPDNVSQHFQDESTTRDHTNEQGSEASGELGSPATDASTAPMVLKNESNPRLSVQEDLPWSGHECPCCAKSFKDLKALRRHLKVHTKSPHPGRHVKFDPTAAEHLQATFKAIKNCPVAECPTQVSSWGHLLQHTKRKHPGMEDVLGSKYRSRPRNLRLECEICHGKLRRLGLKGHIKGHARENDIAKDILNDWDIYFERLMEKALAAIYEKVDNGCGAGARS